jgi:hypothetical protein
MVIHQKKYLLLGDVVNSRHINERQEFEKKLSDVLRQAESLFKDALELPFARWKGLDEVAVIIKPSGAYAIIDYINYGIYPQRMRFVMVKGIIEKLPGITAIAEMDGPVFQEAVAQMSILKKEMLLFKQVSGDAVLDMAFNNQVNLLQLLKDKWTEKQRQLYTAYAAGKTQEVIAELINITQQTVSKALKSVDAAQILIIEQALQQWRAAQKD